MQRIFTSCTAVSQASGFVLDNCDIDKSKVALAFWGSFFSLIKQEIQEVNSVSGKHYF